MAENSYFHGPEWALQSNVYEVNLRQYSLSGSFTAFAAHLPRLKEMGIEILWFMPITPIGVEGRKMNVSDLGSYYAVKNYYQVSSEFGTMTEWKSLVTQMHEFGFKVIIDWVANHTSPDHPWVTFHPDYYVSDGNGTILPPNADWTDTRQLDYNNMEMRNAMVDAMSFWISETDIDGFRCDMAKLVTTDFWTDAITRLRKLKNILMIAEAEDPGYYQAGFDAQYIWTHFHALTDLYKGNKSLSDFMGIVHHNESLGDGLRLTFTSNHDENSWNGTEFDLFGAAIKCFTVLNFTMKDALPMLYSGQEAANKKRLSFFTKDVITWQQDPLQDFYTQLLKLRKNHIVFHKKANICTVATSGTSSLLAYVRVYDSDKVLIILNMGSDEKSFNIPDSNAYGNVLNYLSNEKLIINTETHFHLKAWDYLIFIYNT